MCLLNCVLELGVGVGGGGHCLVNPYRGSFLVSQGTPLLQVLLIISLAKVSLGDTFLLLWLTISISIDQALMA